VLLRYDLGKRNLKTLAVGVTAGAKEKADVKATTLLASTVLGIGCLVLGERPASAEWFADVYAGPTFTTHHDVTIDGAVGRGRFLKVDFDKALSFGGRFGHYFEAVPFVGVAVDYFQFYPNIGPQSVQLSGCFVVGGCVSGQGGTGSFDITERTISVDLMLRLPLIKTADAPQGLVQPYIAVGLPLVITTVDPRNTRLFRNHHDATDVSFGAKAVGGLAVQVYKNLALFAEYRFNHVSTDVDLQDSVSASKATFRTDLNSHSALVGISARW
jgi:opacity protein-like surface antigen